MTGRQLTVQQSISLLGVPADQEASRLIFSLTRRDRDQDGTMLLRAPLAPAERQKIAARLHQLAPYLKPATEAQIRELILQMLSSGFAGGMGDDATNAVTTTAYIKVLKGLPYFALSRSCRRWSAGEVTPDEVGADKINYAYAPSAAFVRIVAENAARHTIDEATIGNMLLEARVVQEMTPEAQALAAEKIAAHLADYKRQIIGPDAIPQIENERQESSRRNLAEMSSRFRLREYEEAGVDPVYADEDQRMLLSLPLMLSMGWRIEAVGDRNVLTHPYGVQHGGAA